MAPCDGNAIRAAFTQTIEHPGPVYFRAGRGREKPVYAASPAWHIGGSNTLREGRHATVLAIGNLVSASLDAADLLQAEGIELGVVDMYSIAPLDKDAVRRAAQAHGTVITAEEHNISSGFGSAVAEVIAEEGLAAKLVRIGMPDEYSLLGPPTHLYRHYGLDGEGVAATVRKALA
jgi:transketolase